MAKQSANPKASPTPSPTPVAKSAKSSKAKKTSQATQSAKSAKPTQSTAASASRPFVSKAKKKSAKRKRPYISTRFRDFKCGHVYHIYQRGNHHRRVFASDLERFTYLEHLQRFALRYNVKIHNFCLMGTHIHLVLEQRQKGGISNMMRDLQSGHAREHNRRIRSFGNLWTQHFGCKHVKNNRQFQTLMWYVGNNPVKSGICDKAEEYLWSGARIHAHGGAVVYELGGRELTLDLYRKKWEEVCNTPEWKRRMLAGDVPAVMAEELKEIELIMDADARREEGNRQRVRDQNAKKEKARERKERRRLLGKGRALQAEAATATEEAKRKKAGSEAGGAKGTQAMRAG